MIIFMPILFTGTVMKKLLITHKIKDLKGLAYQQFFERSELCVWDFLLNIHIKISLLW